MSEGVEIAGLPDRSGTITETFTYDILNRLTNETLAAGDVSRSRSYTYDHDGNMLTMTSPEGAVTTMKYDSQGFMVEKTVGGIKEIYEYDLNGNI
nr:hypothetical protein [Deltaproteobacteria bacterium]